MGKQKSTFGAIVCIFSILVCLFSANLFGETAQAARQMENLGRGVVAVRTGYDIFVSWRLLALDPEGIGFNVYRSTDGGTPVKINSDVLTGGTNFTDKTADRTKANRYFVKPVVGGQEQAESGSFTVEANPDNLPSFTIPIKDGAPIHFLWVGDFDGDHEYDYLIDRQTPVEQGNQKLEAYKKDGTFLWEVDLGPNSANRNNISPGAATVDVGHWDGVTVYDVDGDGKAEVILKIADGVTFGDGNVWSNSNKTNQWLAVLDGMTGSLRAYCALPRDYTAQGPLGMHLGIGYLNGTTPSIVASMKNRNADGSFNMMICAYRFQNSKLTQQWKWDRGSQNCPDGHQIRIADVDEDGKDEIAHIGFVLNGDGTLKYTLGTKEIQHGDRFYIGRFTKESPVRGYGIQQDNTNGVLEYYYNASNGNITWKHRVDPPAGDVGRGAVGDIDPRYPGFEAWSFSGIYNASKNQQITASDQQPYPAFSMWWDGDLLTESFNDGKFEKWDYLTNSTVRLVTAWKNHGAVTSDRGAPVFYGDIMGDWREEVIMPNSAYNQLVVFTTSTPTDTRLYTLAQNPMYRNCMTVKGYMQSHTLDYYLGDGMDTPPAPDIYVTP